jgi:hypothetical protein
VDTYLRINELTDMSKLNFDNYKFFSLEKDLTVCRKFKNGLQNAIKIFEFDPVSLPGRLVLKKTGI